MDSVYLFLDPYLIWFYRLTGNAALNFVLGTLVVALLAVIVGEGTSAAAALLVKRHTGRRTAEAKKYQDLSLEALRAGDRPAYEAANKLANEAFGKSFFMQLTLSATFFWPVFFALGWMQTRFGEVEFPLPLVGLRFSYVGAFVPLYIGAYLLFKAVKKRLRPTAPVQGPQPQNAPAPGAQRRELSSASEPPA